MLAGWRQEMEAEPFTELVDTDTALAAIRAGRRPVPSPESGVRLESPRLPPCW